MTREEKIKNIMDATTEIIKKEVRRNITSLEVFCSGLHVLWYMVLILELLII